MSQHKRSSKYYGSVNCSYIDVDREPDGIYFKFGDFWSIIQEEADDPEPVEEVVREDTITAPHNVWQPSPLLYPRDAGDGHPQLSSGASSGLPPVVPEDAPLEPNMVYTLPPPPPRNVFYSEEVINRAKQLHLHPDQEHMRYSIAQSLSRPPPKPKTHGVFSKLKNLGSKRH